jgi:hypothetical protein
MRKRKLERRGVCELCGGPKKDSHPGRCMRCVKAQQEANLKKHDPNPDPEIEARIQRYTERADAGLPIFDNEQREAM